MLELPLLWETGLLESRSEEAFDRLTRLAATLCAVPGAWLTLSGEEGPILKSVSGLDGAAGAPEPDPLLSLCRAIRLAGAPLVIEDVRQAKRPGPALREVARLDLIAVAGVPVIAPEGEALGSFGIFDRRRRRWSRATIAALEDLARLVSAEVGRRVEELTRQRVEEELAAALEEHRKILESAPIPVAIHQRERSVFVNPQMAAFLGHARIETLIGRYVLEYIPPEDLERTRRRLRQVEEHGKAVEFSAQKVLRDDGNARWAEAKAIPVTYEGAPATLLILRDVTEEKRAREALQASEERLRSLYEENPNAVFTLDDRGRFEAVNRSGERITGQGSDELAGTSFDAVLEPADRERARRALEGALAGEPQDFEATVGGGDGERLEVATTLIPMLVGGRITGVHGIARDVTAQHLAERALLDSERLYRQLFERNVAAVFRSTFGGILIECNEACARMLGYEGPDQVAGLDAYQLYQSPSERRQLAHLLRREGRLVNHEVEVIAADGSPRSLLVTASLIRDPATHEHQILGTFFDVTQRRLAEEKLRRRALFDELTGLANRSLFEDRLEHALARLERVRDDERLAVLFVDLDRFKVINDSLGHVTGDRVLVTLAHRFEQVLRKEDTVARFGGDEFTILLEDLHHADDARRTAERLAGAFEAPFAVDGEEFPLTASIGIALTDSSAVHGGDLVRRADIAMYRAKEQTGISYHVFDPASDVEETRRLQRETELRRSIHEDRFELHFQPIFRLEDGTLLGAEALVRWNHPERGLLPPSEFIPLAEETGLIVELGEGILHRACRERATWHPPHTDPGELAVFVNLSPRQLAEPSIVDTVRDALGELGADPGRLYLEVTESLTMEAPGRMQALKDLGVRLAVDDFGTGYSSLSYLKRPTVDVLKIDSLFVQGLGHQPRHRAIVETVITLGRNLGLDVIAEGIESREQADLLRRLGCHFGQGYYFERPIPAVEFRERVSQGLRLSSP